MSTIIILNFNVVRLFQYSNVLKSRYQKVDTVTKKLCSGKGGLARCISWFIQPSKLTREKNTNHAKKNNIENLVLISEDEKTPWRNSGASNVYTFLHAYFEGVEFYAARRYVNLTKKEREDELFVSDEDEEDDEVLPVSELTLLVEKMVWGVEISDSPCLASGHNSNLTSENMTDLWCQGIAVDGDNELAPENIPVPGKISLSQLEEHNSWISERIIFLRRSKNLHNTNAAFKNYTHEEVTKMKKLEFFLMLFLVDYLKEILITKMNNLLKHPMELGESIQWMGCWFYMGCWAGIPNRRNWWSTEEPTIS